MAFSWKSMVTLISLDTDRTQRDNVKFVQQVNTTKEENHTFFISTVKKNKTSNHLTCKTGEWNSCSQCLLEPDWKSVDSVQYILGEKKSQKIALEELHKYHMGNILKQHFPNHAKHGTHFLAALTIRDRPPRRLLLFYFIIAATFIPPCQKPSLPNQQLYANNSFLKAGRPVANTSMWKKKGFAIGTICSLWK